MRIALISLHFSEYACRLAKALSEAGATVLLLLDEQNARAELGGLNEPDLNKVRISSIKNRSLKDVRVIHNAYILFRELKSFRPDVIHIQETFQDYLILCLPALKSLAPYVLTVHDHIPHSGQDAAAPLYRIRANYYRRVLRRAANACIVHGAQIRSEIEEVEPYLKGRVSSIAHGVLGPAPRGNLASEFGHLLFFGRIEPYKGLHILLDAIRILHARGIRTKLTIAGHGTDLDRNRAAIANTPECNLVDRFIKVEEIPELFQRAMIVTLPYLDGTQSGIAAMAARYGRAVVATNVGSIPEVVKDGVSGLIVTPGDAVSLADGLQKLLENQRLAIRLAGGAKEIGETYMSWPAIAQETIKVYATTKDLSVGIATPKGEGL